MANPDPDGRFYLQNQVKELSSLVELRLALKYRVTLSEYQSQYAGYQYNVQRRKRLGLQALFAAMVQICPHSKHCAELFAAGLQQPDALEDGVPESTASSVVRLELLAEKMYSCTTAVEEQCRLPAACACGGLGWSLLYCRWISLAHRFLL